jgi:hypothetical protein
MVTTLSEIEYKPETDAIKLYAFLSEV